MFSWVKTLRSMWIPSLMFFHLPHWTFYVLERGFAAGSVSARHAEMLFVWDFISALTASLRSHSPSLKRLSARSMQSSTGTISLYLIFCRCLPHLLTPLPPSTPPPPRRLSAASDGTWTPPRTPTTRTRRRWWSAWTLWRKACSGRARADSTASRAGRKVRPRRSPPPPWFSTTARGR